MCIRQAASFIYWETILAKGWESSIHLIKSAIGSAELVAGQNPKSKIQNQYHSTTLTACYALTCVYIISASAINIKPGHLDRKNRQRIGYATVFDHL
jgi:hypothetical protein